MKIAIGCDHGALDLKNAVIAHLQAKNYEVVENRPQAIKYAMDSAKKDDIIVLAGKGHETYQEIMGVKHHLDEREVVAEHLAETR